MPEPTFYTIEHGFVLVGRSEALPSWQRMQQSATRASRSDPTQSTRLFLQVTKKGRLHDLIFVDDLILWCWNIIYIYTHTYMTWLWKTDDLRLVQRRFFPFMVLNFKATEVYLPSRFWGIVQGTMFEFSHAADSFWLQHSVWTALATPPPVLPWVALLPVPCWLVFLGSFGSILEWDLCFFFDIYHVGMATGWQQNPASSVWKKHHPDAQPS